MLTNKKSNLLIQRIESPKPTETFHTSQEIKKAKKKENQIKTTTARLSFDSLHRINSLITMGHADSFNNFLENILDEYESKLSPEDKKLQKTIIKMYNKK